MLIRDANGNIVNIQRSNFVTDGEYYKQLSLFYDVKLSDTYTKSIKEKTSIERISEYIRTM